MVRARDIIRGAVTRTAPGVLAGFAILIGASPSARSHLTPSNLCLTVAAALVTAAGSALTLVAMRTRLRADAAVAGRRAFIVGLAGFAAAMTTRPFLSFVNPGGEYLLMGLSGVVLSAAMFFPWLGSRGTTATTDTLARRDGLLLQEPLPEAAPVGASVVDHDHDA